jgi:hypothetical protein
MEECETEMRVWGRSMASRGRARNAGEVVVVVAVLVKDWV